MWINVSTSFSTREVLYITAESLVLDRNGTKIAYSIETISNTDDYNRFRITSSSTISTPTFEILVKGDDLIHITEHLSGSTHSRGYFANTLSALSGPH